MQGMSGGIYACIMEKLTFVTDDGEELTLSVVEETRVNGVSYLLVTEASDSGEDEEAEAYIMKDVSNDKDADAVYEFVDDETEFESVGKVFDALLEGDIDLE